MYEEQTTDSELEVKLKTNNQIKTQCFSSAGGNCKVQFRRGRKGKITSTKVVYLYSGKEGRQPA